MCISIFFNTYNSRQSITASHNFLFEFTDFNTDVGEGSYVAIKLIECGVDSCFSNMPLLLSSNLIMNYLSITQRDTVLLFHREQIDIERALRVRSDPMCIFLFVNLSWFFKKIIMLFCVAGFL